MKYLLGIDLGTSATKTILFTTDGKIVAQNSVEYPLYHPEESWAEQNPEDWFNAVITTIKNVVEKSKVNAEDIKSIGLSGQMHGFVMLDKNKSVIRNSILWCDGRTSNECNEINSILGEENIIKITGNPALVGFTLSKIIWVRNHEEKNYEKAEKFLLPKDYIRFKLTGEFFTEYSDASGTNLLDIKKLKWSEEILEKLNIDKKLLPEIKKSHEICGYITEEIAKLTGLSTKTSVVAGAADNAAAAIGAGVIDEGNGFMTIGTSGVIFSPIDKPIVDKGGRVHTFCSAVENKWAILSCTLSAGQSLKWSKEALFKEEELNNLEEKSIYKILDEKIENIPIGANKLFFLPYLMGERSPILDEKARGAFIGLLNSHNKYHMHRSVMEGVAYSQRQCLDIVKEMGIQFTNLRIGGGGSVSPVWRHMFADTLNCDIETVSSSETAALGAAILAGVGSGVYESVDLAVKRIVKSGDIIKTNVKNYEEYMKYYNIYNTLYNNLQNSFKAIAEIKTSTF